jgi:hypothetical protein
LPAKKRDLPSALRVLDPMAIRIRLGIHLPIEALKMI